MGVIRVHPLLKDGNQVTFSCTRQSGVCVCVYMRVSEREREREGRTEVPRRGFDGEQTVTSLYLSTEC